MSKRKLDIDLTQHKKFETLKTHESCLILNIRAHIIF